MAPSNETEAEALQRRQVEALEHLVGVSELFVSRLLRIVELLEDIKDRN